MSSGSAGDGRWEAPGASGEDTSPSAVGDSLVSAAQNAAARHGREAADAGASTKVQPTAPDRGPAAAPSAGGQGTAAPATTGGAGGSSSAAAGRPGQAGTSRDAAEPSDPRAEAQPPRADTTRPIPTGVGFASGPGIYVRVYAQTDVGLVREHNEDNFLVADLSAGVRGIDERTAIHRVGPRGSIFAVCDGMGGAAAGEVASQMAVDTLHEVMSSGPPFTDHDDFARRLVRAIEEAGARIFAAAKLDRSRRGMGTTSTVAGLVDRILFVGQIGDSRAYVLRNDELGLITKDQSLVNQLIESGQLTEEEAEAFEHANIILQALGTAENVTVDLTFLELRRGDRLMLCSDGLSGLVHAHLIKDVLATVQDPRAACATLVEMARTGGGHDNITVIVVDFDGDDLASAEGAPRPTYQQYPLPATSERRTTYPPREVGLKGGATKPGSDVKGLPAAAQHDVPAPPSGRQTWMFVALVVVLVLVGVAALAFSGTEPGREGRERRSAPGTASSVEEDDGEGHVLPPSTPLEAPEALRRVRITTDLDEAVLWVDDEEVGPFEATGGDAGVFVREVALLPGVHRFEVRSPTGARVRAEALTVEAGEDASFALDAPRAAGPENLPPSSDGVVVESGGTTRSTSGGSSQTNTDPDGGRFRRRRDAGAEGEAASPRRGGAAGVQGIPDNPF